MSTRQRDWIKNYNIFFITTTFKDWLNILINDEYYKILTDSLVFCIDKYKCDMIAYALMPNHIHFILLFKEKSLLSEFMRDFKKYTSRQIRYKIRDEKRFDLLNQISYMKDGQKYKVWNDRFDAKIILSSKMMLTKVDYIHNNPVKKGLVEKAEDWEFSSASYYITGIDKYLHIRNVGEIL